MVGPIQGRIAPSASAPSGEVAQLGKPLFTTYLFAFEATAALLVIAVVGAVVLARRPPMPEEAHSEPSDWELPLMSLAGGWYLVLAAILFSIGALGLLVRRNVLVMFMCIELMLNAANLTFVTFSRMLGDIGGQAARLLRPGGGRGRGRGGPGHRGRHLPPPGDDHGRRPPLR